MYRRRLRRNVSKLKNHGRLHHKFNPNIQEDQGLFSQPTIPMPISNFHHNNSLHFGGTIQELQNKFNLLDQDERLSITTVKISLRGTVIRKRQKCCFYTTIISGLVCIIPLGLLCSNWYRKWYERIVQTNIQEYKSLEKIMESCPNTVSFYLYIEDNYLNQQKIDLIQKIVNFSRIKEFKFYNACFTFNLQNNEFDHFKTSFEELKQNQSLTLRLKWGQYKFQKTRLSSTLQYQSAQLKMIDSQDTQQ